MRIVIYDDESMEPITVVRLPITDREIEEHGFRYRLAVPPEMARPMQVLPGTPILEIMRIVDLKFERICRNDVWTWMVFTKQDSLAMLLSPDWLPGQRRVVDHLQQHNERLGELLLKLIRIGD